MKDQSSPFAPRDFTPIDRTGHLRDCLADPDCTDWDCPQCGKVNDKWGTLECAACGFDAKPYAPTAIA